jgi:alkylhydroperoxidase family enzyme
VRGRLDQVGAQFGFVPNMFTMLAEDIELARAASSVYPNRAAVARFAQRVIETRGRVSDADLAAVQGTGYTDPQIVAIVTLVVRALLTNYLNNVNLTDVDIPAPDLP